MVVAVFMMVSAVEVKPRASRAGLNCGLRCHCLASKIDIWTVTGPNVGHARLHAQPRRSKFAPSPAVKQVFVFMMVFSVQAVRRRCRSFGVASQAAKRGQEPAACSSS